MKKGLLVLVVSLLVSSMAFAINDLDTGLKAYYQKNYKVAFDSFEKSAKTGNVQAIKNLKNFTQIFNIQEMKKAKELADQYKTLYLK
ncbi:MAG: hypothetical protein LWW88_06200 [Acinetobacter sp.]|uniref:hypothetical protein n=1 Tax=Acinetobacter sp. TaxID=472 RepID=UPI002582C31E|nr:hypothetical protein [Acinetobacter sp.]MCE1271143.1 hypothetical protein [Acinetobacter sp.]